MRFVALLTVAGLLVPCLSAQDDGKDYDTRLKEANEKTANLHFKLGSWLESKKMYEWAKMEYTKAVELDPKNEKAQNKLGNKFNPSTDSYDFDTALAMDQKVLQSKNEKTGDDAKKIREEYEKKLDGEGKGVSKSWSSLGDFAKKNGKEPESVKHYRKALEYDPTNAAARKALAYEKVKEGGWSSKELRDIQKQIKEDLPKAPKGQDSADKSQVEEGLGLSHTKKKSDNFHVESAVLKGEELSDLIQHAEFGYALFLKMFNKEDMIEQALGFVFLKDKGEHDAFVDKFHGGDGRQKDFAKKARGTGLETYVKGDGKDNRDLPMTSFQDFVIHQTIQRCADRMAGNGRLWVEEGLADWFTKTIKETVAWSCVNLSGTSAGSSGRNFQDANNWKIQIKVMARDGEDPSIHEVIKCTNFAEFSSDEIVKAWSLVDFLVGEHKDKFIDLCDSLRADPKDTGEAAFKKVFNWTLEDLDARWKQFVRASY